jgi:hypothetical protein
VTRRETCLRCPSPITQPAGRGRPRRFCDPCRKARHLEAKRARERAAREEEPEDRVVIWDTWASVPW